MRPCLQGFVLAAVVALVATADAGPIRDRIASRRAASGLDDGAEAAERVTLPAGVGVVRDISWGAAADQTFDVYLPATLPADAPVIFMVHGGGWYRGDKAMKSVVENKVRRWVPRGFVFISSNYRMVPVADPVQQAAEIANAIAFAQKKASNWGASSSRFILMGHSAGAHLVALVSSSPAIRQKAGMAPWLGTIALDSGGYDVDEVMSRRHMKLYDNAFGTDRSLWRAASPTLVLGSAIPPFLAVCSTQREVSCSQAERFVKKATTLGARANVAGENLSHRQINDLLGEPSAYTTVVESFLRSLDPAVARRLPQH
jgi:arylformamidase